MAIGSLPKLSGNMHAEQELQKSDTEILMRLPGIRKIQMEKRMKQGQKNQTPGDSMIC